MIYGEKVVLRAITRADLPVFLRWMNDAEVTPFLGGNMWPMSPEAEERWFEQQVSSGALVLGIETLAAEGQAGLLIGNIALKDVSERNRHAELGIVLGRPDGTFGPWDEITRCNVVAMVIRAARQLQPGRLADPPAQYVGSFSPTGWPEQDANLRLAEYNGLLQGLKGFGSHWSPWQCATRGEVAHILAKLMN